MRDDEVYAIVDRYFGIDSMEPVTPLPASEPQSRKIVNVDFGDFF